MTLPARELYNSWRNGNPRPLKVPYFDSNCEPGVLDIGANYFDPTVTVFTEQITNGHLMVDSLVYYTGVASTNWPDTSLGWVAQAVAIESGAEDGNVGAIAIDTLSGLMAYQYSDGGTFGSWGYVDTTDEGGAVTQLTSRTTTVMNSKLRGKITLFSAAGSATPATFTVTNTKCAIGDTIRLTVETGMANIYHLIAAVGVGSFTVTVFTTGGVTVEAPVINFKVSKGML